MTRQGDVSRGRGVPPEPRSERWKRHPDRGGEEEGAAGPAGSRRPGSWRAAPRQFQNPQGGPRLAAPPTGSLPAPSLLPESTQGHGGATSAQGHAVLSSGCSLSDLWLELEGEGRRSPRAQ